jgi:putative FmdB family regulatory protein
MPTYEYGCPNGHHFEKIQKISDRSRPRCPVCGAAAERKISGGAGLVFKGSGFYITDYGKDGKGPRKEPVEKAEKSDKPDKTDKPAAADSTPKAAPGADAKPAAKPASPRKAAE